MHLDNKVNSQLQYTQTQTNRTDNIMKEETKKSWKTSNYKWKYLKLAIIYFTTPSNIYEIAHKTRGANMRERIIRGRLVEEGVLRRDKGDTKSDIDLENSHI